MKERAINFNRNEDKTLVVHNPETEKKLIKAKDEIYYAIQELTSQYKQQKLQEGFKETLLSLCEHYTKNLCDVMGYNGILKKEYEERYKEIRELNTENRELRKQLGEKVSNEDCREKIKNLRESVEKWWNIEGFGHISEISFGGYGDCKMKLSGMITHSYRAEIPKSEKQKVQQLVDMGFSLDNNEHKWVLDTDKNRSLLLNLLKRKYPSAYIQYYKSYGGRKGDWPEMRDIEVIITDLNDIQ